MKEALLALPAAWMRASTATCWWVTSSEAHREITASIIPDISRVLLPTSLGPWRSTDTVWMARSLESRPDRLKCCLHRKTSVRKLVKECHFFDLWPIISIFSCSNVLAAQVTETLETHCTYSSQSLLKFSLSLSLFRSSYSLLSRTEQLMWELSVRGGPSESSGTVPATSRIFFSPAGGQGFN